MKLLIWGYLRKNIEIKFKQIIIPNDIKLLFLKYTGNTLIDSLILTENEKYEFYSLLSKKWNSTFIGFKLLYTTTHDTRSHIEFYEKCNVANTLCLIECVWWIHYFAME